MHEKNADIPAILACSWKEKPARKIRMNEKDSLFRRESASALEGCKKKADSGIRKSALQDTFLSETGLPGIFRAGEPVPRIRLW